MPLFGLQADSKCSVKWCLKCLISLSPERENGSLTLNISCTDYLWKQVLQILKNGITVPPPGQRGYLQVINHLMNCLQLKRFKEGGDWVRPRDPPECLQVLRGARISHKWWLFIFSGDFHIPWEDMQSYSLETISFKSHPTNPCTLEKRHKDNGKSWKQQREHFLEASLCQMPHMSQLMVFMVPSQEWYYHSYL